MHRKRGSGATLLEIALLVAGSGLWTWQSTTSVAAQTAAALPDVAVGPQYDTTHVYVAPDQFDRFVGAVLATFGGTTSKKVVTTVTPTPSSTFSQLILTPVGSISVFGFTTPIPRPFGAERTGYLVTDMTAALRSARSVGANVIVTPFPDPIGMDAIIQWPGGIDMQLYTHNTPPSYKPLETIPENRVYVSPDRADAFIRGFLAFSRGKITDDDEHAAASDIGLPNRTFRRVRIESGFGKVTVLVTAARLPSPYRQEIMGYEVPNLGEAIAKAKIAGVTVLVAPYQSDNRQAAMARFPGGYIAEIHSALKN
jgi:hypothetical protein